MRFDPAFFLIFPVFVPSVRFVIGGPLRLDVTACPGLAGPPSDGFLA